MKNILYDFMCLYVLHSFDMEFGFEYRKVDKCVLFSSIPIIIISLKSYKFIKYEN